MRKCLSFRSRKRTYYGRGGQDRSAHGSERTAGHARRRSWIQSEHTIRMQCLLDETQAIDLRHSVGKARPHRIHQQTGHGSSCAIRSYPSTFTHPVPITSGSLGLSRPERVWLAFGSTTFGNIWGGLSDFSCVELQSYYTSTLTPVTGCRPLTTPTNPAV